MFRSREYKLQHVAAVFSTVVPTRMYGVKVKEEKRAGLNVLRQYDTGRFYRMAEHVAAGLESCWSHDLWGFMWKVKADQELR